MKKLLLGLLGLSAGSFVADAQDNFFARPPRGFSSWQRAENWENALLSGNGTMGAMVMGQPFDETVILSHSCICLSNAPAKYWISVLRCRGSKSCCSTYFKSLY